MVVLVGIAGHLDRWPKTKAKSQLQKIGLKLFDDNSHSLPTVLVTNDAVREKPTALFKRCRENGIPMCREDWLDACKKADKENEKRPDFTDPAFSFNPEKDDDGNVAMADGDEQDEHVSEEDAGEAVNHSDSNSKNKKTRKEEKGEKKKGKDTESDADSDNGSKKKKTKKKGMVIEISDRGTDSDTDDGSKKKKPKKKGKERKKGNHQGDSDSGSDADSDNGSKKKKTKKKGMVIEISDRGTDSDTDDGSKKKKPKKKGKERKKGNHQGDSDSGSDGDGDGDSNSDADSDADSDSGSKKKKTTKRGKEGKGKGKDDKADRPAAYKFIDCDDKWEGIALNSTGSIIATRKLDDRNAKQGKLVMASEKPEVKSSMIRERYPTIHSARKSDLPEEMDDIIAIAVICRNNRTLMLATWDATDWLVSRSVLKSKYVDGEVDLWLNQHRKSAGQSPILKSKTKAGSKGLQKVMARKEYQ